MSEMEKWQMVDGKPLTVRTCANHKTGIPQRWNITISQSLQPVHFQASSTGSDVANLQEAALAAAEQCSRCYIYAPDATMAKPSKLTWQQIRFVNNVRAVLESILQTCCYSGYS